MTAPLPPPILEYVRDFVARRRRIALLRAGAIAIALALALLVATCLLDRWLQLPSGLRLALLLSGAAAFLIILLRPLRLVLRSRLDWLEAADEIESATPIFGQRLRTVVSQLMEQSQYRGSPAMIDQLLAEVTATAQSHRPRRAEAWRRLALPWGAVAILVACMLILRLVPNLGMPTLIARFLRPLSPIPAVTTTRITLDARTQLPRGETLSIRARIERLSGANVEIFTSFNARNWTRIPMLPGNEGEFIFTLPAVDRDIFYYVEAGDARTPTRKVIVQHPPAVIEYRIRYDYPAYTDRGTVNTSGNDGVIDALAGTRATVSIVCTEAIRSAAITFHGGERLSLAPASDPSTVQFSLEVRKSMTGDLELTSAAGLTTRIANGISLKAQPDHEPLVKLLEPANDLRLDPRAILPLRYQLMDDFALVGAWISVQVNSNPPHEIPLPPKGDARRLEDVYPLDLAALNVSVGDVLSIRVVGQDGAGRKVASGLRTVLVAPRSIDINTHQRIGELRQAATLAQTAKERLKQVAEALDRVRHRGEESESDNIADRLTVSRALASAVESTILVHQSLLRAAARSARADQATALADCVDRARVLAASCEHLAALDAQGGVDEHLSRKLHPAIDDARALANNVKTLWEGEQADAILADQANLKHPPTTRPSDKAAAQRLAETLKRAREDLAQAVRELGLDANAGELEGQLAERSQRAREYIKACKTLSFEMPAQQWAKAILAGDADAPPLPERLMTASAVEAIRADGNPIRARDLQLASRVAARLSDLPLKSDTGDPTPAVAALSEFPPAIAALERENRLPRNAGGAAPVASSPDTASIHKAAADARARLALWANASAQTAPPDPEDLAFQATAEAWQRHYEASKGLFHQLVMRTRSQSSDARETDPSLDEAEKIDQAGSTQDALLAKTANAHTEEDARQLEAQQREVAQEVQQLGGAAEDGNSRTRATAAITVVQEQLAHMPQLMATAIDASDAWRQAAARAQGAQKAADAAAGDRKQAMELMAQQAQGAMEEAEELLDGEAAPLSAEAADEMGASLQTFEPETQQSRLAISEQLRIALQSFQEALKGTDRAAVDRAAAQARSAIEVTQDLLREAQVQLMERDPLQAAKWFADASARALAERPPDFPKAKGRQENAGLALARAWQFTLREGAVERLGLTPAFRPVLTTQPSDTPAGNLAETVPSLRQWGFLRARTPIGLSASMRESTPPGYSEAVSAYFQGVSNAQSSQPKKNEPHP
jgi:hypothetical protein